MTVAGSVALALAERVEKGGGARAGLVAYRALAANAADGETRAKALLAGARCAGDLRDEAGLADLVALWPSIDRGAWAAPVAALCRELARAKMDPTPLAHAEMSRSPTALALYTYARCLDVARDARAGAAFERVLAANENAGVREAARLRLLQLLARSWSTLGEALVEAAKLDPAAHRIAVARVLLFSPSRFTRAAAIGHLADAASSDDADTRFRARRLAARYADEAGDAVTPLEQDRLSALLKDALKPQLELTARAQDLLRGRYEVPREPAAPSDPIPRRVERHHQALDVFAALRDASPARAAHSLRTLAAAAESGERLPREAVAVAQVSLAVDSAELRDVAVRFFAAWLKRPSYVVPPRGYLALAEALGAAPEAEIARRAAALRKENGAAESLAILLTRVGWEAARADNRPHAIQTLREAKALSSG